MRPSENIENAVKKMNFTAGAELRKQILNDALKAHEQTRTQPAFEKPNIWRIIMKSRITKLATAAIIAVAVLAVIFSEHSNTAAYAFEQTIAAVSGIKYFHCKLFVNPPDKNRWVEAWVEYGSTGTAKNLRFDIYDKGKISESVAWKEGKTEDWVRGRELRFFEDAGYSARILRFASRNNPKDALEYLDSLNKEGKVKIQIEEPTAGQDDILVTAIYEPNTYLLQHPMPAMKDVYHIDNASRLIKAVEIFELDPNGPKAVGSLEYCDYNQPFASELLDLDKEAPPDVNRVDMMTMDTGIEQGNLSDREIVVEAATQFLDALIHKDYVLAGQLVSEEMTEQQAEQKFGDFHILQVISIDELKLNEYMSWTWTVLFKAVIEKNGETIEQESSLNVGKVLGHPTRWGVWPEELK